MWLRKLPLLGGEGGAACALDRPAVGCFNSIRYSQTESRTRAFASLSLFPLQKFKEALHDSRYSFTLSSCRPRFGRLIFTFGVYRLMMALWPSGWRWSPNQATLRHTIAEFLSPIQGVARPERFELPAFWFIGRSAKTSKCRYCYRLRAKGATYSALKLDGSWTEPKMGVTQVFAFT